MRKSFSKRLTLTLAILALVAAAVSTASAEVLQASATRAGNAFGNNTGFFVALNNAGATALSFNTTAANKLVKITYNAECGVLGNPGTWLSVTIFVDGVQANPASGTLFALCTATSTATYSWTGAVRQSLITVPVAGVHSVQVKVDLNAGATTWWLGDTSLVVEQK